MIALPILIPVVAAVLALMARRLSAAVGVTAGLATLAASAVLAARVWQTGVQRHLVGGWEVPLGIALHADGLAMAMLLLTAIAGCVVSVYAAACLSDEPSNARIIFWPVWLLLWAGLNALYLSSDVFNLYVLLEVVGIAAVALIVQAGSRPAHVAGMRYLLAALMGSLAYLLGVVLLYGAYGTLDLYALGEVVKRSTAGFAALALMATGLMMKTALFPLHFWLPAAHASASTPVSAILSALVIKASFYLMVRLWIETFDALRTPAVGHFVGLLASVAILWGSYQAIRQRRLKLLIAHSTVGQVGYFFLLFPLTAGATSAAVAPWMTHAWTGALYQVLSHGFAKCAMFLAAGVVLRAMGTDELRAMRDIAGRLPVATFALAIAGASLIGLPPSGGFIAKWMLLQAIIASGQWWYLPVVVAGAVLTAGYVFSMLRYTFTRAVAEPPLDAVSPVMQHAALLLAVFALALGFRLQEPLELLAIGSPFRAGE